MPERIISGGQTGADQGALEAAKILGLKTGGWMPKGWRTEAGPRKDMQDLYGMIQHQSSQYPPRTRANVFWSDATLIIGTPEGGSKFTRDIALELNKPVYVLYWTEQTGFIQSEMLYYWLRPNRFKTLNVAGNRESKNPGIQAATRDFLIEALKEHL